jgi:hypothetical protein
MFEMPAARPRTTLQVNPTMTSDSDRAESTSTRRTTWGRRRIRVRKYVNGKATATHTAPARRHTAIENTARSRNRSVNRRW